MNNLWTDLLHLFFPKWCKLCKKPLIRSENQICLSCFYGLPRTRIQGNKSDSLQELLAGKKIEFAEAFLFYEKGGHVQKLIHSLKYHNNKELGYILGKQFALELDKDSLLNRADMLLPVPLHPKRQRKRGYNQAEWIAKGIGSVMDIPVNTSALRKTGKTNSQTKKSVYDRWINVENIFSLTNPEELAGKHVILVDDVVTTGATSGTCIDLLASVPDIRISILALAITVK